MKRRGWYERPQISRINLDWVKTNCKITKREMELLKIIRDRKLVRRDHLEIISPSYRFIEKNRTKILNKSISKLFVKHCIDKIHEEREFGRGGNNPCIVALDRGGSLLLGIPHRKRIIHHNNGKYIKRYLPSNYRHINGVNSVEVQTIIFCEETGNEIIGWHHEKPQELFYGQEKIVLIPDVGVTLKINQKPFYAFLEYDTGTEDFRYSKSFPTIYEKLVKYKKWKMSKLWEKDYLYFPVLLFVTEDDKRVSYITDKCKELELEGWGIYYKNYKRFLERLAQLV